MADATASVGKGVVTTAVPAGCFSPNNKAVPADARESDRHSQPDQEMRSLQWGDRVHEGRRAASAARDVASGRPG